MLVANFGAKLGRGLLSAPTAIGEERKDNMPLQLLRLFVVPLRIARTIIQLSTSAHH